MTETAQLPDEGQKGIEELESERRWDHLFSRSPDLLARMAGEARQEYRAGLTETLDPETM